MTQEEAGRMHGKGTSSDNEGDGPGENNNIWASAAFGALSPPAKVSMFDADTFTRYRKIDRMNHSIIAE